MPKKSVQKEEGEEGIGLKQLIRRYQRMIVLVSVLAILGLIVYIVMTNPYILVFIAVVGGYIYYELFYGKKKRKKRKK